MPLPLSMSEIRKTIRLLQKHGSQKAAAIALNISDTAMQKRIITMRRRGVKLPRNMGKWDGGDGGGLGVAALQAELKRERKARERAEEIAQRARIARATFAVPKPASKRSGKDDRVEVIFPDLHGCHQDAAAVAAFLREVKRIDPDAVYGLGDLVDAEGFLAEHHVIGHAVDMDYSWEQDIAAAGGFLDALAGAAPRAPLELVEGNHENHVERYWVTKALRSKRDALFMLQHNSVPSLLELKKRNIKYWKINEFYDGLPIPGAIRRGKLVITHRPPAGTIEAMALKHGGNVICGHTHHMRTTMLRTVNGGQIGAWQGGCLRTLQPSYASVGDITRWVHGFNVRIVARSGNFLMVPVVIDHGEAIFPNVRL